jgi:hypothetical protein
MHRLSEIDTTALHEPCEEDKMEKFNSKSLTKSLTRVAQAVRILFYLFTFSFLFITEFIPVIFILIVSA